MMINYLKSRCQINYNTDVIGIFHLFNTLKAVHGGSMIYANKRTETLRTKNLQCHGWWNREPSSLKLTINSYHPQRSNLQFVFAIWTAQYTLYLYQQLENRKITLQSSIGKFTASIKYKQQGSCGTYHNHKSQHQHRAS